MMKLAASLLLLAMVVSGQEHHSVQKRQTTVTYSQDWTEIASSFVSAAVTIGIITLTWWVVAPIFGFETLTSRQGLDFQEADYGGYYNYQYSSNQYDPGYSYYNYYQGRSFQDELLPRAAKMLLNSIDLVDTAFNYMDIEDETCRLKTICEVESYAINHPLAKLAINTINKSLSGLERYQDAIDAGMNGQDCALIYDQCPFSYFGY